MKVVILAGGLGTRLSEETYLKPKPMVQIGEKPILWHIMKIYSLYGINDFIVCTGYKGYLIKEYFANYSLHNSDFTVDFSNNKIHIHSTDHEGWTVTVVDTGQFTQTGGRLLRVKKYLDSSEDFCFTYGDGLIDLDINKLIAFHKKHKKIATITATLPPGRFGALDIDSNNSVTSFLEKPKSNDSWINGGFFVLSTKAIDNIIDDNTVWEHEPLSKLSSRGELMAYKHYGFWQPMDTLREKNLLNDMYVNGKAPWAKWRLSK